MDTLRTQIYTVDPAAFDASELDDPASFLREGAVVAFPTETVYGLGANAADPDAIRRLIDIKDRPKEKPFSIHIADFEDLEKYVSDIPPLAKTLAHRYWPGPLTMVLPQTNIDGWSYAGIGIRFPSHPVARELIRRAGVPVVAPSANLRGQKPAAEAADVMAAFDGKIPAIVDGGPVALKEASSVIRILEDDFEVLREGIISEEMIRRTLRGKRVLFVCTGNSCRSPIAEGLLRRLIAGRLQVDIGDLEEQGYVIRSAGTAAFSGGGASRHAVEVMAEMGVDISGHEATPVTRELAADADLIITLSPSHRWQLVQWDRDLAARVEVIRELGVADPIGGELETYRQCAMEIEREILDHWLERVMKL